MATSTIKSTAFTYLGEKNYNEEFNVPANAVEIYCIAYSTVITNWETVSAVMLPDIGKCSVSVTGKDVMAVFYYNDVYRTITIPKQTNISKYRVYYR